MSLFQAGSLIGYQSMREPRSKKGRFLIAPLRFLIAGLSASILMPFPRRLGGRSDGCPVGISARTRG